MTTSSSHHALGDGRRRLLSVRRSSAAVAVCVMIIGAPLVVRALADESGAEALSARGAIVVPDPSSTEARPVAALDDREDQTAAGADDDDEEATSGAEATDVDTPDDALTDEAPQGDASGDPVLDDAERDRVTTPPLDIHAVLTDSYSWDERSLRVAALQQVLNVGVDGWYSPDTRLIHLQFLEFIGLSTDQVPDVPPPGPSAEQWAALRDCESGGDYSIVSSSGRYRGAYQFARTTWDSVAEQHDPSLVGVDPATATPAAQDAMARALHRQSGASPWPVCGRHLS